MSNSAAVFHHKNPFTLGVEEEYMLCDPDTGEMVNAVDTVMKNIDDADSARFSYELIQTEVEVNTRICRTAADAVNELGLLRSNIKTIGDFNNFRLGISGTHPTAKPIEQKFVSSSGYQWVANQLGYYAKRNITFATHVHVAVPDSESAIHITNSLRRWVGPLFALSTNSPFFEGIRTGMLSSRVFQFGAFPRTNVPTTFQSFDDYENLVKNFINMNSIEQPRQIWWKIRPSLDFGTIEFRMFDVQRSFGRTKLLIALAQALTHRAWMELRSGKLKENLQVEYIDDCIWKASRFDFSTKVMDPFLLEIISMEDFIRRMLQYAEPSLTYFKNMDVFDFAEDILKNGSEAVQQLKVYDIDGMTGLKKFLMDSVEYR